MKYNRIIFVSCFKQEDLNTPLMISGTPVERVSSFKYLGVNISEDLTWTTHMQTQVKKAIDHLKPLKAIDHLIIHEVTNK